MIVVDQDAPGALTRCAVHLVVEQLCLFDIDWSICRGRRPRRDRGWLLAWQGPLHLVPSFLPPPGSQVIDRVVRAGRQRRRELWVRARPGRRR